MEFAKSNLDFYTESIWNIFRPYVKCACRFLDPKATCESSIMWFDHAIWFILNHLELLFPEKPVDFHLSLICSWLGGQAKQIVIAQIDFNIFRGLMHDILKELKAEEPGLYLTTYANYKGVKYITNLLKPCI
ncbi:hypothetical protein DD594_26340, partial [Enterobacter cloacae complex sp. 4DZ1-17B1]|uniref:hypothetical protein n=1 Tax=Enterobacter cloacae complex sp. 4DZ1-17B1 TaxID=2511991 RepID=UPI0010254BA1